MDTLTTHTPRPDAAHICTIVPPYLLQAMGTSDDPALRSIAEHTLRHDDALRSRRSRDAAARSASTGAAAGTDAGSGTPVATAAVKRSICDAKHGTDLPGAQVRAEGAPASSDTSVNEAYDALGDTWRLYDEVYGRDSVDGHGLELVGSVHYSTNYDNAFWNGEQMVFGDGDGVMFTRFTASVDVIGHELTHGVTQYTAALVYNDQPGALNESMSDVFGSLVKQYALKQNADQADWLIGAGILGPKIKGRALRDMLHPGTAYDDPQLGKDPQPADMAHYVTTTDDNGGVHLNSGIPNRAFALAATTAGGPAWEGVGQVWYDVLTGSQIQARCDFATFASLTVDAAAKRFGADHAITAAVRQAWTSVGVLGDASNGTKNQGTGRGGTGTTAGAGGDAASAASIPDTSGADATPVEVQVSRSGGFAGIARQSTVQLGQLPPADAEHWRSLLASGQLREFAARSGEGAASDAATPDAMRDGYTYAVRCTQHGVDETLTDQSLPTAVRHLIDRTLDAG